MIFVAPQGADDAAGNAVWGGQADLDFFIYMLRELSEHGLQYNANKLFVVGHSAGGGFTHELGCAHGDVFRAIVPAAGGLISTDCVGSLAVLMLQGANDMATPLAIAVQARDYWVKYDGWDLDASVKAYQGQCDDYSFPDKPDNLPYPVVWCLHQQGHSIPDFGFEVAWDFLASLPEVARTPDSPPGGGAEVATPPSDALLTFTLDVPADINWPLNAALTLRPLSFIDNSTCSAPDVILTGLIPVDGLVIAGQVSEPITVPITCNFLFGAEAQFPSDWASE